MCRTAFLVVGLLLAAVVSMASSGCDACVGTCGNCGAQGTECCGDMLCLPYQGSQGIVFLCGHNDTICNVP